MTEKSDDRVGHLNTILAQGGGNLNDTILKSPNGWGLPEVGGMLKFRVDRRITGKNLLCYSVFYARDWTRVVVLRSPPSWDL